MILLASIFPIIGLNKKQILIYLKGAGKTWTVRAAVDRLHKKFGSFDYEICEITLASYSGPELFGWEDEKGKYNFG